MVYSMHEVVRVLGDAFLVSSAWYMCRYVTHDKEPLSPGFYFLLWPARLARSGNDQYAQCFGPFSTKALAEKLKTSALGLGIIGTESDSQIAEGGRFYALQLNRGTQKLFPSSEYTSHLSGVTSK